MLAAGISALNVMASRSSAEGGYSLEERLVGLVAVYKEKIYIIYLWKDFYRFLRFVCAFNLVIFVFLCVKIDVIASM